MTPEEQGFLNEMNRLKNESDRNRHELLRLRGFVKTGPVQTSREGIALWEALPQEQKDRYNNAAKGLTVPGSGLFFMGYREKTD
jgi:hypothetical protein